MFLYRRNIIISRSALSSSFFAFSSHSVTSNEELRPATDDGDHQPTSRSSNKTKTARTMARLINSRTWSPDLQSSLCSFSRIPSKTTVLQTLRLISSPSKAYLFFKWAHDNGFTHNDQTYFLMLEILGHSRNLNAARNLLFSIEKRSGGAVKLHDRFFNCLIRSYGQAGLFQESIKLYLKMKSVGVSPSVVTFNSLLSVLLRRGRTTMAKKLYDEMLSVDGITPDAYTFNILIRGFCMNSMVEEGFRFFKEMSRFGCDPDLVTYNTLVDGLCRAGKVRIAHNLFKGMLKKRTDLNPNVVTYTTLIRGYCKKRAINDALDVFEEMVSHGMKPNKITYNTLLQGLCEARELDKIKQILEGMMAGVEFVPDTCTFNTLMNAHCNAGKLDEALNVFDKMSELKVKADSATYSVLIRSLCQREEFGRAEKLLDELLEKEILVRDVGCVPLIAAYNPIFEYLCHNGKTKKADGAFRQLLKRGKTDPTIFKTLIMGHCKEGTFQSGYDLLVLMLRRDYVPDMETYESLIEGFLQKGEPVFAYKAMEKMLKSSHRPKTSMFHSVLAALVKVGCAQETASFILLMLERKIRQNANLSTEAVSLLFKSGLRQTAFEVVGLLYESGYSIKMKDLVSSLCRNRKFLDARELLLFSFEKNHHLTIEIYSEVITGLCKIGKASEAFALFYESIEKGMQLGSQCLRDLNIALVREGRSKEAEFVSKKLAGKREG